MNLVSHTDHQFLPLSEKENQLAKIVVDIAFDLHKALGPGLLESVYEKCFCYELRQRNIPFLRQQLVPVYYKELFIDDGLRLDILVDDLLIIELKAQENNHPRLGSPIIKLLKAYPKANRLHHQLSHTPYEKRI